MVEQDVIEKLKSLTTRQKETLKKVCEGLEYKEIGADFFISENTVKTHMGHVYIKLGIDHLTSTLRKKIILEVYCPAIHELEFSSISDETEQPEQVSEEVLEMVEEDQKSLITYHPEVIEVIQPRKVRKKKKNGWKWIVVLVMLALMAFGGFKLYEWGDSFFRNLMIQPTQELANIEEIVQQTIEAQSQQKNQGDIQTLMPTQAIVVPTNTELPPTPIPTRTPSPKISLPYIDDFSNGINSPWSVGSGNWFVTDSGASISINDIYADAGSIVIDDPSLTDYKLRVKVHTPHMYAASQGQFGVIVRYSSTRDQNIIFYMDSNGRFRWAYATSLSELPFYLPPITGVDKDLGSANVTLEIVVSGNTFIARVDGAKVDQFSMTGYENGGIVLITSCGSIGSCPSFSDLSIEPIN
jgi:DNA-binding CsgD family transcriptional regulator